MLTISASPTHTLCPAGVFAGRCSAVVDAGTHEEVYQGKTRLIRALLLRWDLRDDDENLHRLWRRFNMSFNEKSTFRQFARAWRGRDFNADELQSFDLKRLLNAPALLTVEHRQKEDGSTSARIAAASPLAKGMKAPDLAEPPLAFDVDVHPDKSADEFAQLPPWVQKLVESSVEFAHGKTPAPKRIADLDDDVPY